MKSKIIRPAPLAKMLGISKSTLWRLEQSGVLPPKIQITSKLVGWNLSHIENWLTAREVHTVHPPNSSRMKGGDQYGN